jgi:hypothetical protein
MSLLEELLAERGIKIVNPNKKPKCFTKCNCGDMQDEHCTNRDYPVMSKCVNCRFYFGYLEKRNQEDYETDCVPCKFKNQSVAECKVNCPLGKKGAEE